MDHVLAAVAVDLARAVLEVLAAAVARGVERVAQGPAALLQAFAAAVAGAADRRPALGAAQDRELADVDRHQPATPAEGGSSRGTARAGRPEGTQARIYVAARRTSRPAPKGGGGEGAGAGAPRGPAFLRGRKGGVPPPPGASGPPRAAPAGPPWGGSFDPPLAPGDAASIAKA